MITKKAPPLKLEKGDNFYTLFFNETKNKYEIKSYTVKIFVNTSKFKKYITECGEHFNIDDDKILDRANANRLCDRKNFEIYKNPFKKGQTIWFIHETYLGRETKITHEIQIKFGYVISCYYNNYDGDSRFFTEHTYTLQLTYWIKDDEFITEEITKDMWGGMEHLVPFTSYEDCLQSFNKRLNDDWVKAKEINIERKTALDKINEQRKIHGLPLALDYYSK